ncbi:MAG TPA: hypothetical protein VL832_12525 [Puia sp.]|nr:hypothetical protein [Puia sp.]
MHTLRQKNNILRYSLQQSCRETHGNGLFEIQEIDSTGFQRNAQLLLPHRHVKELNVPVCGTLLALLNPGDQHALKISEAGKDFLDNLFRQIEMEHQQQQDWKNGMLQSYLKIFLVYLSLHPLHG